MSLYLDISSQFVRLVARYAKIEYSKYFFLVPYQYNCNLKFNCCILELFYLNRKVEETKVRSFRSSTICFLEENIFGLEFLPIVQLFICIELGDARYKQARRQWIRKIVSQLSSIFTRIKGIFNIHQYYNLNSKGILIYISSIFRQFSFISSKNPFLFEPIEVTFEIHTFLLLL